MLLIEDDEALAHELDRALTAAKFVVTHGQFASLINEVGRSCPAVVILDRLIRGQDSLEVLGRLRSLGDQTPVILISSLDSIDERIRGLRNGGDDYLIKPFAIAELVARAEVAVRRPTGANDVTLSFQDLSLDLIKRTARRGARPIALLPREFQLLEYFVRHADQLVTRSMLLSDIWKYNRPIATNVVDAHILNLRKKINGEGETKLIRTIRGAGFILSSDP